MIRVVPETGSTNDAMAAWAAEGAGEGDWLVARRQTAGRGRAGRIWSGPAGNLHASGLVRLIAGDPPAASLALVAGVAAAEAVRGWLPAAARPMLKWPNDVLVGGAKLCGILIEREDDAAIVGVGINLVAAPALDRATTSVVAEGGAAPDVALAAAVLAARFAEWLGVWRSSGVAAIAAAWRARAHPIGTALRIGQGAAAIEGDYAGLTEDGRLRLRMADGAERVIHAGDVALR